MKRNKSTAIAVLLSLMMVIVFVPQMSFAEEPAADEPQQNELVEQDAGDVDATGEVEASAAESVEGDASSELDAFSDVEAFDGSGEADYTCKQIVSYEKPVHGVAVIDDVIYTMVGSSIKGFKAGNNDPVFSVSMPAQCTNLCSYGDYLFTSGYMASNDQKIYVLEPKKGSAYKTLDAGSRSAAVAVSSDGYLYSVNSTGEYKGKKATVIFRAKVSDVLALPNSGKINWINTYQPNYTAPASDKNCYPKSIDVDGAGNIYIADAGFSNGGTPAALDGIYKYNPSTGAVTPMYFSSGNAHILFTSIYDVCADDYGNVAVAGRNNAEVAVFRHGSNVANAIVKIKGYVEGVGMDAAGNIYCNASYNQDGLYKITLNNTPTTGVSILGSKTINIGSSFTLSPQVTPADATNKDVLYTSANPNIAAVSASGTVTGKAAGKTTITVRTAQGKHTATCAVTVNKLANPLNVAGKTAIVKKKAVKKKNQTLGVAKVLTFKNGGQGTKTYVKASGNKKITIAKSTGKVTVKKGLKKGTYPVKVKVTAAGNAKYKAITKTVTFKVKVK